MSTIQSNFQTILNQIKKNTTPIVFVAIISLATLSIVRNNVENNANAKNFVEYTEESTPFILNQTVNLQNSTTISGFYPDSFEETDEKLRSLEEYLGNRIEQIPIIHSEEEITQLNRLLEEYLNTTLDQIQAIIEMYEVVRSLESDMTVLSKTEEILNEGDNQSIQNLILAATNVQNEFETFEQSSIIYTFLTREYLAPYETINILANSTEMNFQSSEELWTYLVDEIGDKYPPKTVLFPIAKRYLIETQETISLIQGLQDQLEVVKNKYNIE